MKGRLSGFLQSKFNVSLCMAVGWKWARRYVRLVGAIYFFFRWKEKMTIKKSIGTVFASGKGFMELHRIKKAVMSGIVLHYYEKLFNAYCSDEISREFFRSQVVDDGLCAVRTALAKEKGVLLVTGHYGGVEFIPGYLGAQGIPVSIVVRFASDELRKLSSQKGKRFHIRIIDADRTPNVFFSICRHLKENRVVITQCDEIDEWKPAGNRLISFLGRQTSPDRTLTLLQRRTGCRMVFALMHRSSMSAYRFIARDGEAAKQEIPGGRAKSPAEIGLKFVESFIYRYPQGWYQWKKYPAIQPAAGSPDRHVRVDFFHELAPSFKESA